MINIDEIDVVKFVQDHSNIRTKNCGIHVDFQPGNGTRYIVFILPVNDFDGEVMGYVSEGVLVTNDLTGKSYLFQADGYLTADYVAEKLFNDRCNNVDVACVTAAIGVATQRETNVRSIRFFGHTKEYFEWLESKKEEVVSE